MKTVVRFTRDETAQDLIEYALLAALLVVFLVTAMRTLSDGTTGIFSGIQAAIERIIGA